MTILSSHKHCTVHHIAIMVVIIIKHFLAVVAIIVIIIKFTVIYMIARNR